MLRAESSWIPKKRSKRLEMAAEASIALFLQQNSALRISEPSMNNQVAPETYEEVMNFKKSNAKNTAKAKAKAKAKATDKGKKQENRGVPVYEPPMDFQDALETYEEVMNSKKSNPKNTGKGKAKATDKGKKQENRGVPIYEPPMGFQDALETYEEVMNSKKSNPKNTGKGKAKATDKGKKQENRGVPVYEQPMDFQDALETNAAINSQNSNSKVKGKVEATDKGKKHENRWVPVNEPLMDFQDALETNAVINSQNSNSKVKGKANATDKGKKHENRGVPVYEPSMDSEDTLETNAAINSQNSNSKVKVKAKATDKGKMHENRGVLVSEPSIDSEDTLETNAAINNQNSNSKVNGKVKATDKGKKHENRGVPVSEPPMGSEDELETNAEPPMDSEDELETNAEPPMDSDDELETNAAINSQDSNSKDKGKGKGNGKGKGKTNGPKTVLFNHLGQPVGENAAPLAHFLSKTAKSLVPLTVPSWFGNELTDEYKKRIWNYVQEYYIIDDSHRKYCFQKMAKYWREHRSLMIKKFKKGVKSASVKTVARNTRPANVPSFDLWMKFVKFCLSPKQEERRKYFQELRKARKVLYHSSKKSLACIEHELKESSENPDEITRVHVWLTGFSRKKKDGDEGVEEQEVVRKVKEKVAQQPDSSEWTIYDDPITQVLGPERRGMLRGFGFGATPSRLIGKGFGGSRYIMMEKEVQDLKTLVNSLLSRLDNGENSSENNTVAIPPSDHVNTKKDTTLSQKRKNVSWGALTSPQPVRKKAPQVQHLQILSWLEADKIVAIGELASKDPDDKVHCVRLGPHYWKVWVRYVIEDIALSRPTEEFDTLSEAIGSTVAWPSSCIKLL